MPMPSLGLFQIQDPSQKAMQGLSQASQTYAAMDKKTPKAPGKTVGGAIMNAAGGGLAGVEAGKALAPMFATSAAPPAAVGAGAGLVGGTTAAATGGVAGTAAGVGATATAGSTIATGTTAGSMAGPYGMLIGAGIGALAYFLS